jgi:hypothetical protein
MDFIKLKIKIELEALITERESMIAFNQQREQDGLAMGYDESAFLCLATQMRDLIIKLEKSNKE